MMAPFTAGCQLVSKLSTPRGNFSKERFCLPQTVPTFSLHECLHFTARFRVRFAVRRYLYPIYNKCMEAATEHDKVHPVLTV